VIVESLGIARGASAQSAEPGGGPDATARAAALFDEARKLADGGDLTRACATFRASYALDARLTTQVNIALCQEKAGAIASAWAEFRLAAARAKRESREDLATLALAHVTDLKPRVPTLRVLVRSNVTVALDGQALDPAALGSSIPVNPGARHISATAPGCVPWADSIVIEAGQAATVTVPALARLDEPTPKNSSASAPRGGASPLALVLFGGAVVGAGMGTYFGLAAIRSHRQAEDACTTDSCGPDALDKNDAARTQAWLATGAFGVAVAAGAAGAFVLYRDLNQPHGKDGRTGPFQFSAGATPDGIVASARARW